VIGFGSDSAISIRVQLIITIIGTKVKNLCMNDESLVRFVSIILVVLVRAIILLEHFVVVAGCCHLEDFIRTAYLSRQIG
jgi:hypothetical protein